MKPAELRDGRDRAVALDRSRAGWRLERERSMRAGGVGVRDIRGRDAPQMPPAEQDDLAEELAAERADFGLPGEPVVGNQRSGSGWIECRHPATDVASGRLAAARSDYATSRSAGCKDVFRDLKRRLGSAP